MCGLVVFTKPSSSTQQDRALQAIRHRGYITTENTITHGPYTFCHTRLPIQGLATKFNQPMRINSESGVFAGEVFNLPGENDAEAALTAVTTEGPEIAKTFDGFFAMAYTRGDFMYAQTDHLGIKPLYYDLENGIIASELNAIRAATESNYKLDEQFFSTATKWGYDPSGRTPLRNVRRIPPGTFLTFHRGKLIEAKKYWDIGTEAQFFSLDIVLREAVERRVRMSDVPVATLCSGGLDSTIITLLAQEVKPDIQVFHIADDGPDSAAFDLLRHRFPTDSIHTVSLSSVSLSDAIIAADIPVDLGSVQPQYALACALKSAGVKVVLSGDGADELFGGYRRAKEYDSQHSDTFVELPHYHLPRLDAIMMNQTIELRSPFLAPKVVQCALALPYHSRTEKQALKMYFCDLVPRHIRDRDKHPLKTKDVIEGGIPYRRRIQEIWRKNI